MPFLRCRMTVAILVSMGLVSPALAFDLEDYATTYRATRDAMSKAANEVRLAHQAYMQARDHAMMHGWVPDDEDWQMPPGLVSGSCEFPGGPEFGTNISGPDVGHAFGAFIREMADVLSNDAMDAILRSPGDIDTWYRALRDHYLKLVAETLVARVPTQSEPNLCIDQVYYKDFGDLLALLRARRDAYLKAINEYGLSIAPYKAALAAYRAASDVYTYGIACDPGPYLIAPPTP